VAAVRSMALVSDEKRIRGVRRTRRCAIQIDNLYLYLCAISISRYNLATLQIPAELQLFSTTVAE